MQELKSYLMGSFQSGEAEGTQELFDPSTGEVVATTSTQGLDLAGAVAFAREKGGPALRAMTFAERGAMLKAMSKVLYEKRDELLAISARNAGTTRSDGKYDVDGATGTLAYYASLGKKLGDRRYLVEGEGEQLTRSARFWGVHVKQPIRGVAVHINAFNFPAWGFAEKAAVALLAGVPVITKPATDTAWLTYECIRLIVEANIPPEGALQLLCGEPGDLLSHLGPQDALAFTGSARTGALLRGGEAVVHRSTRVNVEADSLNAAVVGPDIEVGSPTWQMLVRDMAKEITQKTGQKCTATRRIFVPSDKLDALKDALAEELDLIKYGHPDSEGVRMGPLASKRQQKDCEDGIAELKADGAEVAYQFAGEPIDGHAEGAFFPSTLLIHRAPKDAKLVHEREVFGPVSTLMPYETIEDAIELVGRGEGGLVASAYTNDRAVYAALIEGLGPWSGRLLLGSKKVADQAIPIGMVLPSCIHGGPGRAGGGEELGGERGLDFYLQRTAVQGDRALLSKTLGF